MGCTRHYFLIWYDAYKRAMGRSLPAPYYSGPPVPGHNHSHDLLVEAWRAEDKARREAAEKKGG